MTARVHPFIQASKQGFILRYRHGETIHAIQVKNPHGNERGVAWMEMADRRLPCDVIPLVRRLAEHRIPVRKGETGKRATGEGMISVTNGLSPAVFSLHS